jgi:hypothetical protein
MTVSGISETLRKFTLHSERVLRPATKKLTAEKSLSAKAGAESPLNRIQVMENPASENAAVKIPEVSGASRIKLDDPETLNYSTALELCMLSQKSYSEYNGGAKNIQFHYMEHEDHQTLAFAGSAEMKDFMQDADFAKVKYAGMGRVHRGFAEAFDSVKPELSIVKKDKPILITGHSLGGALATLTALHLKQSGYDVHSMYNFGSPRVGDNEFSRTYGQAGIPSFRFVNSCDIVPNVPVFGYDHIKLPVYVGDGGKVLPKQESAYTYRFWSITERRFTSHEMKNYLANLKVVSNV